MTQEYIGWLMVWFDNKETEAALRQLDGACERSNQIVCALEAELEALSGAALI